MKSIDTIKFSGELVLERSWGTTPLGTGNSSMELFELDLCIYQIEWVVEPPIDEVEHIGIWTRPVPQDKVSVCTQELIDYDGIMGWLPDEAIALLERNGIAVGADFRPEAQS